MNLSFSIRVTIYLIGFLAMALSITLGPQPTMFVNLPAILLGIVVPIAIMAGCYGKKALFFYSLKGKERNAIIDVWSRCLIYCSGAGVIISFIQALATYSSVRDLGPPLALCLLVVLYALLARLFFLEPFRDI